MEENTTPVKEKPKKLIRTGIFLKAIKDIKSGEKNKSECEIVPSVHPEKNSLAPFGDKNKSECEIAPPLHPEKNSLAPFGEKNKSECEIAPPLHPEKNSLAPFDVRNKPEKESQSLIFAERNSRFGNYGADNKTGRDKQSDKYSQRNSKANLGAVKKFEGSIQSSEQSNYRTGSDRGTDCEKVNCNITNESEHVSRSISCPTSYEKSYKASSDKNSHCQPNQIRPQKHSSGFDSGRGHPNHENRNPKNFSSYRDKYNNTDKAIGEHKYHRSVSETDHNDRFSESNEHFRVKNLTQIGDNWCNFGGCNQTQVCTKNRNTALKSNLRISINRNSNTRNVTNEEPNVELEPFGSASDHYVNFKSESFFESEDGWSDCTEEKPDDQHSEHRSSHERMECSESLESTYQSKNFNSKIFLETEDCIDNRNTALKTERHRASISTNSNRNNVIGEELNVQHLIQRNRQFKSLSNLKPSTVLPEFVKSTEELDTEFSNLVGFIPDPGCFIPPPVPPATFNKVDFNLQNSACEAILDQNGISLYNVDSDSSEVSNRNQEIHSPVCEPDSKQLESITEFILGIVKEKSASNTLADRVLSDINRLFKHHLEGNIIDVYGSYASNLAISTSDINLMMKPDTDIRRGYMYEVYKVLNKEQDKYNLHAFEEKPTASQTKILFSDPNSGVSCQLAYLGKQQENTLKMGKFLRNISMYDQRVRILIIAVKIWAEMCLINEVEEGKLHSVGFTLLMIHFLQHYEKPVLPIPIDFLPNNKLESPPTPTSSSVGELWVAFLKYYAETFNWIDSVVTLTSKEAVSKQSKDWDKVWMAIENPFTGENIAQTVINSDTAEFIKSSFKSSYEYFCNPPDDSSSDSEDGSNNGASPFGKWQYSFNQCMADQDDLFCERCDEDEETCHECKKKISSPVSCSFPPMTEDFLQKIREALYFVYEKSMLTDEELRERKVFVENLQKKVRNISYGYKTAELNLFGSSTNGFGFKNGDLDICLTFKNKQMKNTATILKDLRLLLRRDEDFDHSIAIFNATIPIVKFHYTPKKWRGDICVNNTLAVHNSRLLHTYTVIDERCKILGCALRLLAKKAMINEVTEKALSSYSYSIMAIHFLQQTDPPVLPVLQDPVNRGYDYKCNTIVENCNIWFYEDINKLKRSTNNTPVEQLWLDLLDYYCSYDNNQFITIRQKEPLLLGEKQISARLFNIQDPFIKDKNLGTVVSQRMAQETGRIFQLARRNFRKPKELPAYVKDLEDYFFSTMSLTGRIHKEAHCDLCGKYGHETKDCKKSCFPVRKRQFTRFRNRNYNWKSNSLIRKPANNLSKHQMFQSSSYTKETLKTSH